VTILDVATGTQLSETEWLEIKKTTLGASEIAGALGLLPSTYSNSTPIDSWQRKIGTAPPVAENEAMYWGKVLEPLVMAEYEKRHGVTLRTQLFVRHPEYPWLSATLDGLTPDDEVIQGKTAGSYAKGWGDEDAEDDVPIPYLIQTHQEMMCIGARKAVVPVLIGGQRYKEYRINFDPELAQRIITGAKRFWWCVQNRVCPDWGVLDARALAILNPECEGTVELDHDTVAAVQTYAENAYAERRYKKTNETLKNQILAALGNAQFGRLPNGQLVKRYLQEMPEQTKVTKSHVRHYFRVLKGDDE
jgi:putative phage-type endonuclease